MLTERERTLSRINLSFLQPTSQPFSRSAAAAPGQPVILLTHEYAPFRGGVATYVREIAAAAQSIGVSVAVWTVDYQGRQASGTSRKPEDVKAESSGGFPVVRLRSNGRLTPGGLLTLAWGIWRRRVELRDAPVVLMSVGAQMAFFLLMMAGVNLGGRVTCCFYGSDILRFGRNPFWRMLARRFYRKRVVAFVVITRYVERLLRESELLPEGADIVVAPCALPSAFHVEQRETTATPDKPEGTFRVLTVARLHPRKGQLEVAQALALLPDELRARVIYQVVGVGDAAYRQAVETTCHEGGVQCEFLGAVDDRKLGEIYAQATVYVQASRTLPQSVEGFGITFLEAGIYGCPVAAWRSGGVPEAVVDGETGLLVDEGDVPMLATSVERLIKDVELRQRMGERGKVWARSFHWEGAARILCMASVLPNTGA